LWRVWLRRTRKHLFWPVLLWKACFCYGRSRFRHSLVVSVLFRFVFMITAYQY
jgi:hypothetical protein